MTCVRTVAAAPPDPASPVSPPAGAQAAIVFIKEPSSQDALQGRRALLRCEVEAPGPVHVYWLLDGAPVQDTERRFAQGSSLSFAAVDRLQDSGVFQCVARDDATGEEARSANASFNIKCESRGLCPPLTTPTPPEPCRPPPFPQLLPSPVEWGRPGAVVVRSFRVSSSEERKLLIFPNVFFSFKSGPIYLLDAFANGKSNEAMWPSVRLGLPGTRQALGPWGPRLQPCPQLHRASLCRLLALEPLGSIISCLSPFPSALPPLLCSVLHSATVASATGIETGPVVLKHPASEAEIQPQTQVTLRCHIDGHPW